MSRTVKHLVCSVGLVLGFGCGPSVPVPPPDIDVDVTALTFSQPSAGTIVLTGKPTTVHDSAQFFVTDLVTGDGVITKAAADGSFTTTPFAASVGDTVKVQFIADNAQESVATCIPVVLDAALTGAACGK